MSVTGVGSVVKPEKTMFEKDNGDSEVKKTKPRDFEAPFDLEEDLGKPQEKYGKDFDVSDDENNEEEVEEAQEELYKSSKVVPHSMPMNINFGIDPFTHKARPALAKEPKEDAVPNGSIYENMQILSRSIQSDDYRNRVWGTKPEESPSSYKPYSQSYQPHHIGRPRAILVNQTAQRGGNISEETLEETSSLETPK